MFGLDTKKGKKKLAFAYINDAELYTSVTRKKKEHILGNNRLIIILN